MIGIKVYEGQTAIEYEFKTGADLTDATDVVVEFTAPYNKVYTVSAVIEDISEGIISCELPVDTEIFSKAGKWAIQPVVTFSDGRDGLGETAIQRVYKRGT